MRDEFEGQISMFGMDDMDFGTIGITGGADEFEEEPVKKAPAKTKEAQKEPEAETNAVVEAAPAVKKSALLKLKIDGVMPCMSCGKLLTKTVEGDRFKATCNCCNVSYAGNN